MSEFHYKRMLAKGGAQKSYKVYDDDEVQLGTVTLDEYGVWVGDRRGTKASPSLTRQGASENLASIVQYDPRAPRTAPTPEAFLKAYEDIKPQNHQRPRGGSIGLPRADRPRIRN